MRRPRGKNLRANSKNDFPYLIFAATLPLANYYSFEHSLVDHSPAWTKLVRDVFTALYGTNGKVVTMKITLIVGLLFLSLMPAAPTAAIQEPCKPFTAVGKVRKRLVDALPPLRRVVVFELAGVQADIKIEPPSRRFFNVLRPGTKVRVVGRQCQDDYFADSVKRVR